MDFYDRLDTAFAVTEANAKSIGQYTRYIQIGEKHITDILDSLPPEKRTKVASYIIQRILKAASEQESKRHGKAMKWSPRRKWAPVREWLELVEDDNVESTFQSRMQSLSPQQQLDASCDLMVTALYLLDLPAEQTKKILSQIANRVKGGAKFRHHTAAWQEKNMPPEVQRYVDQAIQRGQKIIRFDFRGMNQATRDNWWRFYDSALKARGMLPYYVMLDDPKRPQGVQIDITDSLAMKQLMDIEIPLAKQGGPGPDGRYSINVGDIPTKIVRRGRLDQKRLTQIAHHFIRAAGLDPATVRWSTDPPGKVRLRRHNPRHARLATGKTVAPARHSKYEAQHSQDPLDDQKTYPEGYWDLSLDDSIDRPDCPLTESVLLPKLLFITS